MRSFRRVARSIEAKQPPAPEIALARALIKPHVQRLVGRMQLGDKIASTEVNQ